MADAHEPLHAIVGNMWVPVWAIRPGAYRALAPLASTMPLWLLLLSRNDRTWVPCYASRESLGATLGTSRATVARQLEALRKAALLFEVDCGMEKKSRRHRPPARWALDPFAAHLWREKVEEGLARIAEQDGHDGRWYHNAIQALDAFHRRSSWLGAYIAEDMPVDPRPRRRKKRKKSKKRRAATQNEPWAHNEPPGEGFTRDRGEQAQASSEGDPSVGKHANRATGAGGLRQPDGGNSQQRRRARALEDTRHTVGGHAHQRLPASPDSI